VYWGNCAHRSCTPSASRLRSMSSMNTERSRGGHRPHLDLARLGFARRAKSVHRAEPRWTPLTSRPRSSRLRSMSSLVYTDRISASLDVQILYTERSRGGCRTGTEPRSTASSRLRSMNSLVYTEQSRGGGVST
jgi:hypothetical protein